MRQKQLQDSLPSANAPKIVAVRWMLAAEALLLSDDSLAVMSTLQFLGGHEGRSIVLRLVGAMLSDQDEFCFVSLRFLSVALMLSSTETSSLLHLDVVGSDDLLSEMIAVSKTNDPSLMPYLLISLQSLALGPCAQTFSSRLATVGGMDALRMVLGFSKVADKRLTATVLLSCLFASREGSRLCQQAAEQVATAVIGTQLEKGWNLVRRL